MRSNLLLEKFLKHIDIEMGYSSNTIKTYKIIINSFNAFLNGYKIEIKN